MMVRGFGGIEEMPFGRKTDRKRDRHRPMVLRLALSGTLILSGLPAVAQTVAHPAAGPAPIELAPSSRAPDGERSPVRNAQFMPGMPQMAQMPPMMAPMQGGTQGSMGGGMAMVMTGDTMGEMMAGACAAGLLIGGVAAAAAGPLSAPIIVNSAGIGCGVAVAATAAGMAGMLGWRTAYNYFK
jgi:hypothetical protein